MRLYARTKHLESQITFPPQNFRYKTRRCPANCSLGRMRFNCHTIRVHLETAAKVRKGAIYQRGGVAPRHSQSRNPFHVNHMPLPYNVGLMQQTQMVFK